MKGAAHMNLTVKFYDVEHGSCTHVITPNGKHFLFDIGTKTNKSICEHLKNTYFYYSGRIDYLVITHPHIDHIADLENLYTYEITPRVLSRPKEAFPLSQVSGDSQSQIALKNKANYMNDNYNSPIVWEEDPSNPNYNGNVKMTRFSPTVQDDEKEDVNNYSIVEVLEYSEFKVVITGDNPSAKLLEMLGQSSFKTAVTNATVLLAPHHGRDSDFCKEFLEAVNPRLTVFSDKPIVHDTQAHSAQKYAYATRGVTWNGQNRKVFTTRNDGTITFIFDPGGNWSIDTSTSEY
jgi:competence protein ComEC